MVDGAYPLEGPLLMCMQCMAGAATMMGSASGVRAWLATREWSWITPRRLHRVTLVLLASALVGSGLGIGGASPPTTLPAAKAEPQQPAPAAASTR